MTISCRLVVIKKSFNSRVDLRRDLSWNKSSLQDDALLTEQEQAANIVLNNCPDYSATFPAWFWRPSRSLRSFFCLQRQVSIYWLEKKIFLLKKKKKCTHFLSHIQKFWIDCFLYFVCSFIYEKSLCTNKYFIQFPVYNQYNQYQSQWLK